VARRFRRCFGAGVGDAEAGGGEDAVAVFADRAGEPHERSRAAAAGALAEAREQLGDVVDGEAAARIERCASLSS
jgi:hypothetical protein